MIMVDFYFTSIEDMIDLVLHPRSLCYCSPEKVHFNINADCLLD